MAIEAQGSGQALSLSAQPPLSINETALTALDAMSAGQRGLWFELVGGGTAGGKESLV